MQDVVMNVAVNDQGEVHDIDPSKCRVREVRSMGWRECLENDAAKCRYSLFFGSGFLCRYPDVKNVPPQGERATSGS